MRATFYKRNQTIVTGTAPTPIPAPGEALLRVRRVGICGSDLHIFQGHLDARVPSDNTIGHEVLAEVADSPDPRFPAGSRVVVNPVIACGECRACRMGAYYLCYSLKVMGVDAPGGLADYWAVPTKHLLAVPTSLRDDDAALIEPLAVAAHDVNRADVKAGDAVAVFGGGPIGSVIALVCRHRGARVRIVEPNPHRRAILESMGFETLPWSGDVAAAMVDWTDGAGVDVAFEVSGSPEAAAVITETVRVWGLVSIIAIHSHPVPMNLYPVFAREIRLHGSRLYTNEAWTDAIGMLESGALDVSPLVTKKIPIEAVQQGMEEALGGGPVMKILVDLEA